MAHPSVSICIPTYEPDPRFLGEMLASVVSQRYEPLEVLVVDDASTTDPSPVVAELDAAVAPVCKRNAHRLGMVGNWNHAVSLSSGELVMVAGQDDVLGPGMVARLAAELAAGRPAALAAVGETFIDAAGLPLGRAGGFSHRSRIYVRRDRYELDQVELARLCLRNGQAFGEPSAVLFRRPVFDEVGGYRERYPHAPDVDFNLRAAGLGTAVYVSEPYLQRRLHGANESRAQLLDGTALADHVRLIDEYGSLAGFDRAGMALLRATMADLALRDTAHAVSARRWDVARRNLAVAWRFRSGSPRAVWKHLREVTTGRNVDER